MSKKPHIRELEDLDREPYISVLRIVAMAENGITQAEILHELDGRIPESRSSKPQLMLWRILQRARGLGAIYRKREKGREFNYYPGNADTLAHAKTRRTMNEFEKLDLTEKRAFLKLVSPMRFDREIELMQKKLKMKDEEIACLRGEIRRLLRNRYQ